MYDEEIIETNGKRNTWKRESAILLFRMVKYKISEKCSEEWICSGMG